MQILPNHEVLGIVRDVIFGEDEIKIIFAMDKEIDILKLDVPKEITRELIGARIAILNLNGKYYFRRV